MSLATRLSGFFLAALATALVAFSVALFLLAWAHLQHDFDEALTRTLDTLSNSVDLDSDEAKWRPSPRPAIPEAHPGEGPVRWAVFDDRGRPVDRTWDLGSADLTRIWRSPWIPSIFTPPSWTRTAGRGDWPCGVSRPPAPRMSPTTIRTRRARRRGRRVATRRWSWQQGRRRRRSRLSCGAWR